MKTRLLLSLLAASVCAAPPLARALDAVPPKPPGGDAASAPSADKPADKPDAKRERRPGGPGGPGPGGERRMDGAARLKFMTEKLSLTPEQQDKVKAIQEKNEPQFKELMAKGRENLTDEDKKKFGELMRSQMEEIGAVLTPEQREKMKELRGSRPGGDRKPGDRPGKPGEKKE